MDSSSLNITVIICAYTEERWYDLVAAIESVKNQTISALEIIVVIDYNENLLKRSRASLKNVIVINNEGPKGLCGARNSGAFAAKGEIVAFLDDDAVASPEWLEHLQAGYRDENIIGVGGAINPLWSLARPAWFPEEFYWVVGCSYQGLPTEAGYVRNLIGANMSFRRTIFHEIGGFSSSIGQVGKSMIRCDDTEYCIRVRQQLPSKNFLYQPKAVVGHRVPLARTTWKYFYTRCYTEGIAKSLIAKMVGPKDGLSSERSYIFRTLPAGISKGIYNTLLLEDPRGFLKSSAIVAGLMITGAGYIAGIVSQKLSKKGLNKPETSLSYEKAA